MNGMSTSAGRLPSDPADLDPAVVGFRLILAAGHRLRAVMDEQLRPAGLTTQQASVMSIVEAHGGAGLGQVATALGTSHQNVRQIADALVRKGLLDITADPDDGRRRVLQLTPAALEFWAGRRDDDADALQRWFAPLERDEVETLVGLLGRLVDQV